MNLSDLRISATDISQYRSRNGGNNVKSEPHIELAKEIL